MQTSGGEESRVLREGDVRRENGGVPSQPCCVYLNGQHDRHGKAAKGFSKIKRGHKKKRLAVSLAESQQDCSPGWLGGFLPACKPPLFGPFLLRSSRQGIVF